MLFSACHKEEIDSIPEGAIKLTTEGFSNGDGSKTSVNGYTVEWVNGDKVTINNEEYTVFVDGSTAYITPGEGSEPTAPSAPYYGYYSCGTVNEPSSTNPTVTVPASYSCSYDGSGRQVIALPMVSYQSSTASAIAFKHVTAAVNVTVKNSLGDDIVVDKVTVSSTSSKLSGTMVLNLGNVDLGVARQNGSGSVSVTLGGVTLNNNATCEVQVPILPIGASENLTITINVHKGSNYYTYEHTASVPAALTRNKMLTARCDINLSGHAAPTGAINGKFTINASGNQVYFSQGNLQATTTDLGVNWTWAFATNQWDYIGYATANNSINGDGTVSTNGTVDLFGWVGASSIWTGAAQYGISNSLEDNNTDGYGNVADEALKSDWGTLAITNGGNTANSGWRTLTFAEWKYLFRTRASGANVGSTGNARYTFATIRTDVSGGVNGIILFPDDVTFTASEFTTLGDVNEPCEWETKCTSAQWTALAAKGCVFLPAAGYGSGVSHINDAGSWGSYWSSSSYTDHVEYASGVQFRENGTLGFIHWTRSTKQSVRLVKDAD